MRNKLLFILLTLTLLFTLSIYAQDDENISEDEETEITETEKDEEGSEDSKKSGPIDESKEICSRCGEYYGTDKCCNDEGREWDENSGMYKGSPGDSAYQAENPPVKEEAEEIKAEQPVSEPSDNGSDKKKKKEEKPDTYTGATKKK